MRLLVRERLPGIRFNGSSVADNRSPDGTEWGLDLPADDQIFYQEPEHGSTYAGAGVTGRTLHLTEKVIFTFRVESLNLFNCVQFGGPNTAIGNSLQGRITSRLTSRLLQLAGRINF